MYDPQCEVLAKYFLINPDPDEGIKPTEANIASLAQEIQDAIESWFQNKIHEHTCQQCDKVISGPCGCDTPDRMDWCSANCRAAFDL